MVLGVKRVHCSDWEHRGFNQKKWRGWFHYSVLARSGNAGPSSEFALMVLCNRAAERSFDPYLYLAWHLFFPPLLPLSTSTIS
jgi:hypothetical protein